MDFLARGERPARRSHGESLHRRNSRAQPVFDIIQLHGQETPALCVAAAAHRRSLEGVPPHCRPQCRGCQPVEARAILIDSATPGGFGGTGALIDLDEAARFVRACPGRPVWLSGGLNPENVGAAVEKVRPFGVDVASGVEAPGNSRRKDWSRIRAFIAAARAV